MNHNLAAIPGINCAARNGKPSQRNPRPSANEHSRFIRKKSRCFRTTRWLRWLFGLPSNARAYLD